MKRLILPLLLYLLSVSMSANVISNDSTAHFSLNDSASTSSPLFSHPLEYEPRRPLASHLSASMNVNPGWLVKFDDTYQIGRSNFALGAELHYRALPSDNDAFADDYDYPTLSFGVKYGFNHASTMHRKSEPLWGNAEEVDYTSRIGNTVSMYGTFTRTLYRYRRLEADASISMGVAYSHSKYNCRYAIDNDIVGSRWLIHFGAGLHLEYRLAPQWGLRLGADYWHVSNGALNRPNKGANYLGPSLALRYYFNNDDYDQLENRGGLFNKKGNNGSEKGYQSAGMLRRLPYTYLRFTVGVGMKTLDEEWKLTQFNTPKGEKDYRKEHFHHYMCYSFSADFMVRYARRWASGMGVDMFYATYADAVHDINTTLHRYAHTDPFAIALSAKHETFYHNVSIPVSLGVYLYRAMGAYAKDLEKPYYETVGLHYTFPSLNSLRLGVTVKAHLFKADYTELVAAYPIALTKKQDRK